MLTVEPGLSFPLHFFSMTLFDPDLRLVHLFLYTFLPNLGFLFHFESGVRFIDISLLFLVFVLEKHNMTGIRILSSSFHVFKTLF